MKRLISSRNIKVVLAIVLAITCINGIGLNLNDHPIQVPDGTSSRSQKPLRHQVLRITPDLRQLSFQMDQV